MKRGEIYIANLNPTEGSKQFGTGSVIIASHTAINDNGPEILVVPCATDQGQRIYLIQVGIGAGEGGLWQNSLAMAEQVSALDKVRLNALWGALPDVKLDRLDSALLIALDLTGQN